MGGQDPLTVKVRFALRLEEGERVDQVTVLGKDLCRQKDHLKRRPCGRDVLPKEAKELGWSEQGAPSRRLSSSEARSQKASKSIVSTLHFHSE